MVNQPDADRLLVLLREIADPEIPAVNIVEMGMIRSLVLLPDGSAHVAFAPTFSGCPALHVIRAEIERALHTAGVASVIVENVFSPPWTSDAIEPQAREKLRVFGLGPPPLLGGVNVQLWDALPCPRCGSTDTRMRNAFGSTLCRMIYTCQACKETFEQFKPV